MCAHEWVVRLPTFNEGTWPSHRGQRSPPPVDLAHPAGQCVPSGENPGHHPSLMILAKDAHRGVALKCARDAKVDCRYGKRATDGRPPFAHAVSRIAESAIVHRQDGDNFHVAATAFAVLWEFHGS